MNEMPSKDTKLLLPDVSTITLPPLSTDIVTNISVDELVALTTNRRLLAGLNPSGNMNIAAPSVPDLTAP